MRRAQAGSRAPKAPRSGRSEAEPLDAAEHGATDHNHWWPLWRRALVSCIWLFYGLLAEPKIGLSKVSNDAANRTTPPTRWKLSTSS